MEWVHECRFLTREQIQRLEFGPGSASQVKRRLTLLYHNGYLGRLVLPVGNAYGASRAVYYLDRGGAHHLARRDKRPRQEFAWGVRGQPDTLFLAHLLDTNDVRIAFTLACQRQGLALDWWDEPVLRRQNVKQCAVGPRGEMVTLLPDGYFTVGSGAAADGFALEVDRGTVAERRMRARFRAYGEWAASGAYRCRLPVESLRVLVAVTSYRRDSKRLERLKRWCEDEGGRSLFWFIDREGLERGVLDDPVWQIAGTKERCRLILEAGGA